MSKVEGPASEAEEAWLRFSEQYGSAYLYRTSLYTPDDALHETARKLGYGWGSMEELLHRLGYPELSWDNTMPRYTSKALETPWLGIIALYDGSTENYFTIIASLILASSSAHLEGWSFRGLLLSGVSNLITFNEYYYLILNSEAEAYIVVPQVYVYIRDGYLTAYTIDRINYMGCTYWAVIPYTVFVPGFFIMNHYTSTYEVYCSLGDCGPIYRSMDELYYSHSYETLLDNITSINGATSLFRDSSLVGISYELSGGGVNILRAWGESLLELVVGRGHPVYSLMKTIIHDNIQYTYYTMNDLGIDHSLEITSALNTPSTNIHIRVEKSTFKIVEKTVSGDPTPLLIRYIITLEGIEDPDAEP